VNSFLRSIIKKLGKILEKIEQQKGQGKCHIEHIEWTKNWFDNFGNTNGKKTYRYEVYKEPRMLAICLKL